MNDEAERLAEEQAEREADKRGYPQYGTLGEMIRKQYVEFCVNNVYCQRKDCLAIRQHLAERDARERRVREAAEAVLPHLRTYRNREMTDAMMRSKTNDWKSCPKVAQLHQDIIALRAALADTSTTQARARHRHGHDTGTGTTQARAQEGE